MEEPKRDCSNCKHSRSLPGISELVCENPRVATFRIYTRVATLGKHSDGSINPELATCGSDHSKFEERSDAQEEGAL
jgi:hypothetical protein